VSIKTQQAAILLLGAMENIDFFGTFGDGIPLALDGKLNFKLHGGYG